MILQKSNKHQWKLIKKESIEFSRNYLHFIGISNHPINCKLSGAGRISLYVSGQHLRLGELILLGNNTINNK